MVLIVECFFEFNFPSRLELYRSNSASDVTSHPTQPIQHLRIVGGGLS